jgi:DNA invertase Pin-like site-specific DNA recombinase
MNETLPVFAYVRVSGISQVDGDGFTRQREAIDGYCRLNHMEVKQEFREEGISGTKDLDGRPALTEMMVALQLNGVRTVLVERADRLARDLMVNELLLKEFQKMGVKVISADSGIELTTNDTDDPSKKLIRQMLAAVAEYEKSALVNKLRVARLRFLANGGIDGSSPYGKKTGEMEIVQRMATLYNRGKGLTHEEIAAKLNSEGIKSRYGKLWHTTSVFRTLKRHATNHQANGAARQSNTSVSPAH